MPRFKSFKARRSGRKTRWSKSMAPNPRRGMRRSMISRGIRQPVQYFKRSVWLPNWITTTAVTDSFAALKFNLSQVPQFTEFTQLYDQYCIKGVKFELIPQFDSANVALTTSQNVINQNYSCIDYDDVSVPSGLDTLLQYQNVQRCPSTRIMKRYIKPKVATQVYSTALTTNYSSKSNVWLDCTQPDTEHYGVKFGFTGGPITQKYGLRMIFYMAFKNVR